MMVNYILKIPSSFYELCKNDKQCISQHNYIEIRNKQRKVKFRCRLVHQKTLCDYRKNS